MRQAVVLLLSCLCLSLHAKAEEVLHFWNWNDYIDPQVLSDFEKTTGIRVDYQTYATDEELNSLLAKGVPADLVAPSHDQLPSLIAKGLLQPLDPQRLPNRSHLDHNLLGKLAAFDPQNRYTVPYLWGAVGLAINTPQAEAAFGGPLPESWSLLFDPQQSGKLASCGISLLDAPSEVLAILMTYQGRTLTQSSPKRIEAAATTLQAIRPFIRYIDNDRYIDDLQAGKLCLAMTWSAGDALLAQRAGQPVQFIIPQEGSLLYIDNLAIPAASRQAALAHQLIDYLLQPEVAARITSSVFYPSANEDAGQYLAEDLRNAPGLYPDRATKRRLYALEALPKRIEDAKNATWARFAPAPDSP